MNRIIFLSVLVLLFINVGFGEEKEKEDFRAKRHNYKKKNPIEDQANPQREGGEMQDGEKDDQEIQRQEHERPREELEDEEGQSKERERQEQAEREMEKPIGNTKEEPTNYDVGKQWRSDDDDDDNNRNRVNYPLYPNKEKGQFNSNDDQFYYIDYPFNSNDNQFNSNDDQFNSNDDRFDSNDDQFKYNDGRFNSNDNQFNSNNDEFNNNDDEFNYNEDQFNTNDDQFNYNDNKFNSYDDQFNYNDGRFNFNDKLDSKCKTKDFLVELRKIFQNQGMRWNLFDQDTLRKLHQLRTKEEEKLLKIHELLLKREQERRQNLHIGYNARQEADFMRRKEQRLKRMYLMFLMNMKRQNAYKQYGSHQRMESKKWKPEREQDYWQPERKPEKWQPRKMQDFKQSEIEQDYWQSEKMSEKWQPERKQDYWQSEIEQDYWQTEKMPHHFYSERKPQRYPNVLRWNFNRENAYRQPRTRGNSLVIVDDEKRKINNMGYLKRHQFSGLLNKMETRQHHKNWLCRLWLNLNQMYPKSLKTMLNKCGRRKRDVEEASKHLTTNKKNLATGKRNLATLDSINMDPLIKDELETMGKSDDQIGSEVSFPSIPRHDIQSFPIYSTDHELHDISSLKKVRKNVIVPSIPSDYHKALDYCTSRGWKPFIPQIKSDIKMVLHLLRKLDSTFGVTSFWYPLKNSLDDYKSNWTKGRIINKPYQLPSDRDPTENCLTFYFTSTMTMALETTSCNAVAPMLCLEISEPVGSKQFDHKIDHKNLFKNKVKMLKDGLY